MYKVYITHYTISYIIYTYYYLRLLESKYLNLTLDISSHVDAFELHSH